MAAVRRVVTMIDRSYTVLNAEQVPTLSGKGIWAKSSVRHVLARFDSEQGDAQPQ